MMEQLQNFLNQIDPAMGSIVGGSAALIVIVILIIIRKLGLVFGFIIGCLVGILLQAIFKFV